MLSIQNVTKTYGKGGVKALDAIDLELGKGELFGFIGPNGAGKTTAIRLITGSLRLNEGEIAVCGHSIKTDTLEAKRSFGYVPDGSDLFERLTGFEYLDFLAGIYKAEKSETKEYIERSLEMYDLKEAAGQQIRSYSRGMKQKMAIIGSLIHKPPVWILDEPMVGLDPKSSYVLKSEMQRHCENGGCVFFSTHVLEVAERLCTRIAIINRGKIIAKGSLEELRQGESGASLEQLFLEKTEAAGAQA